MKRQFLKRTLGLALGLSVLALSPLAQAEYNPKLLRIGYFYVTGKGAPMPVEIRIPVPAGKEAEAAHAAEVLMGLKKKQSEADVEE